MRARRAIGRTATAVVLAMVVVAGGLVPSAPTASAALPDSIPFEVVEHYDPGGVASIADNTYIYSCRYIVLALFDADEAFMAPVADGSLQPHIMAKRANQTTATKQRVVSEIPAFTYRVGPWDLGRTATMPKIEIPAGKLAYIWYAVQTDNDQYNTWAPTTTLCSQTAQLRASGQSPTNARNLLGLYPENSPLDVVLSSEGGNKDIGDQVPVSMKITNTATAPIEAIDVLGEVGLEFNTDYLGLVSGPDPQPPTTLAPGESVTLNYVVETLRTGRIEIKGGAEGTLNGAPTSEYSTTIVMIPPELDIELSSSVTTATKVGDEFTVTAKLTNRDEDDISGIRAEPLSPQPDGRVSPVSGPTTADGNDPRTVPFTLASGESTTVTWTLLAEVAGSVELTAQISGRDPRENSLFFLSESLTVGIESPALEISDLRMQPGSPVPGDFGVLRGTITNVGSLEVTDIDFALEGAPDLFVAKGPLAELDPSVSPRIPTMAEGESREFLIPFAMDIDAEALATYTADVTFTGKAVVGGVDTEITAAAGTAGGLDLTPYWTSIIDEVRRKLLQDTLDLFEGVNTWGEKSTLAGVSVGSGQGVLNAFQKLGDGLLLPTDLLGNTIGSGGVNLTDQGKAIVEAVREYRSTATPKKMLVDFANVRDDITVAGVGVFANWMRDVDVAATEGDYRKVAELITEPATDVALGVGAEKAGGQLFAKLIAQPMVRRSLSAFQKAPKVPDAPSPAQIETIIDADFADLKDIPTGVRITGQTVERAGVTPDEHAWMIEQAKEHGVAFFVRPRPPAAAKWAKLGFNAKPMAIKLKSITGIDIKWLGYADTEGIVAFRKPTDPLEAMMAAVDRGDLEWGGPEIDRIIARYNKRLAEYESFRHPFKKDGVLGPEFDPQEGFLFKVNGGKIGPNGELIPGNGVNVKRYGNDVKTTVSIDADGQVIFDYNGQPVFSDIDLLSIAKPDGTAIPQALHEQISEAAGFGIDGQHGDSVMTSDFANWDDAKEFATTYANEHKRGGDPLVIVQPDVTTLGYVDEITVPEGEFTGSNYELFGKITTTYEGAGRR